MKKTEVLKSVAKEVGGKPVFLDAELNELIGLPGYKHAVEQFLSASGKVSHDVAKLLGIRISKVDESGVRSMTFTVPVATVRALPILGGSVEEGELGRSISIKSSHAKWRNSPKKRLVSVTVSSLKPKSS